MRGLPLLSYVLPVVNACHQAREFEIVRLLRRRCPRLQRDALASFDTAGPLNGLQRQIGEILGMLEAENDARVGGIVRFMRDKNLMAFDERYVEFFYMNAIATEPVVEPAIDNATLRFMKCGA